MSRRYYFAPSLFSSIEINQYLIVVINWLSGSFFHPWREIDTVNQTFKADFFVEATWRDPKFKGKTEVEIDGAKVYKYSSLL